MLLAEVDFSKKDIFEPAKINNVAALMNLILPLLTFGGAFLCLGYGLYGAYLIITGGDTPEKIKKGQQTLIYSVLGLFIVLFAYVLVKLVGLILGINNILPI